MEKTNNPDLNTAFYWDHIYANKKDQEELEKKSAFGEEWVRDPRTGAPIRPSKRFATAVDYVNKGDKVLDIGCGFGIFVGAALKKHPKNEVWGVDISKVAVKDNAVKYPKAKFLYGKVGSLEDIPDNYFDVVFAGEILEHLQRPQQLFEDAHRALKKGGTFICTTPLDLNVNSPEHLWFFHKEDMIDFYKFNGFEEVELIELPGIEKIIIIFGTGKKI